MPDYALLGKQIEELAESCPRSVPVLANAAAVLYEALFDVNWVGFYLVQEDELLVGPFQGKPACVRIPQGKGVCGTAWEQDRLLYVPDVHAFPGHIACDAASRSEIVVPLHSEGAVCSVLDIDSPLPGRFGKEDQEGLQHIGTVLERVIVWGEP